MKQRILVALPCLAAGVAAQSTAGAYDQCGGSGYTGPTACVSGYTCTDYNAYYYQCVPGTTTGEASTTSVSSTPASTTATATTTGTTSGSTSPTSSTAAATTTTTTDTATPSGTSTLSSGWFWIRAVETPYYHSYLQTLPTAAPGDALMDSPLTAGQFNIIDGQLVYNTGSGAEDALYMWVEDPADKTQRALLTWFNSTENTYGNFSFSGDTVTWVDPDVDRGNTAAFYVCPDNTTGANDLYVNTGAYDYETPSGCYDIDIHSYGGSTATV